MFGVRRGKALIEGFEIAVIKAFFNDAAKDFLILLG
jgi:hypothetical protein